MRCECGGVVDLVKGWKARRLSATPRITLEALERECGVAPGTISKIERAENPNPGARLVDAIEGALSRLEKQRIA